MKKYLNLLVVFTAVFLFSQCKKETVITTSNHINFENLAIGQKSYYINFKSKNPTLDSNTAFKATTDTILLKVIDKNENGFLIKEEWLNTLILPAQYYFKIQGDSLLVKPISSQTQIESAFFNSKHALYILTDKNFPLWKATRWGVLKDLNVFNGFGKLENVKILNKNYSTALAFYDSNQIVVDGPAYAKLYTKSNGFISFQTIGGFAPYGSIFNLMP